MNKYLLYFLIIIQFSIGCEEDIGLYETPEVISDMISLMEENDIDIDLHISVNVLEGDSLHVDYFLINNTMEIDTIIVSSGFPVNISYRYGKDLNSSNAQWIFPSDGNILALPFGDSVLIESRVLTSRYEKDYLLRAIYTFSLPESSNKGRYWLVSNPVLINSKKTKAS